MPSANTKWSIAQCNAKTKIGHIRALEFVYRIISISFLVRPLLILLFFVFLVILQMSSVLIDSSLFFASTFVTLCRLTVAAFMPYFAHFAEFCPFCLILSILPHFAHFAQFCLFWHFFLSLTLFSIF